MDRITPLGPRGQPDPNDGRFKAAVALSADARQVDYAADGGLTCWDRTAGEIAWQIPLETRNSWALALSPDGQRVAVGCPCPRRQATFHFHLAMKG